MGNGLINATEMAYKVGKSVQTISSWYKFKMENPDNEYAHMLPDYVQIGSKRTRYWKESDVEKLIAFCKSIPQGRNGVLGSVTQRYVANSFRRTEKSKEDSKPKTEKTKIIGKSYIAATEALLFKNGVNPDTVSYVVQILKEERTWRENL